MGKRKLLRKGKVKDVYEAGKGLLEFEFSDRVSSFDVILPTLIPKKGEVLCRFGEFFFKTLGVRNCMVKRTGPNRMLVKKLDIVPMECVVRGYLYGSLFDRVKSGEVKIGMKPVLAAKFPEPFFDPTTKFEKKDRPVSREEVIRNKWVTEEEYEWIREKSIELYNKISDIAARRDFLLADIKFEFGRDSKGNIMLADSIGPDEFRLWPEELYSPGRKQESYDKQVVRDWLEQTGYKKALDDARKRGRELPKPPVLPKEIVDEVRNRYTFIFEALTGQML